MCPAHIGFEVEVMPVTPLSEGGSMTPANMVVLCPFCRWLVQRHRVSPTALKAFKKAWEARSSRTSDTFSENGMSIQGDPLRLEAKHRRTQTVLEGSELDLLLSNFFNCLDTFLIHEDQHLENAVSLAVIRAFRDMYNYVPPERDIKELVTADSRKLDLLYRGVRSLFSAGLGSKARRVAAASRTKATGKSSQKKATKKVAKKKATKKKTAKKPARKKAAKKPAKKKAAMKTPAKKKSRAAKK